MSDFSIQVTGQGTAELTLPQGAYVPFIAFQQTAGNVAVSIAKTGGDTKSVGPNTTHNGGNLTFVGNGELDCSGSSNVFTITATSSGGLMTLKADIIDIQYNSSEKQITATVVGEDGSDNDYNDVTLVVNWFKSNQ